MDTNTVTRWFLGANSAGGFYSLYDGFASGDGDFLRIIKGGPGGGKSGLMRRLGGMAEDSGLDVHYILCSGDPDSLDGVYLPQIGMGWVDGTAPHVAEPSCFGACSSYLDLGRFCDDEGCRASAQPIRELSEAYRARYRRAFGCVSAAEQLHPTRVPGLITQKERDACRRRAAAFIERNLPRGVKSRPPSIPVRRFISALTCRGALLLEDTIITLCKQVVLLDDKYGLASDYLDTVAEAARERGLKLTLCPDPACPERTQALLLPELSVALLADDGTRTPETKPWRHVRLDALIPGDRLREHRAQLRADAKLRESLTDAACRALGEAKALHDALEALYNPHVDFAAIEEEAMREWGRLGI